MTGVREFLLFFYTLFDKEIIALILSLPRIYAFLATSQLLSATAVPRLTRGACILSFAVIAVPINLAYVDDFDRSVTSYALYFAKEYVIGFLLGYLVGWVFWAVEAAGALIDNQRGAAIASSIDPLQGHESSPLGNLFSQAFLTFVFISGAALPLLGLLYEFFALWPATKALPIVSDAFPTMLLALFDQALRFAVLLAGPIIAIMFLAEFSLAMVSRFAPQIQVFILAMPIKSALAGFILIFYLSIMLTHATKELSTMRGYTEAFRAMLQAGERLRQAPPATPQVTPP